MNRLVFVVLCSAMAASLAAQQPAAKFEVASVKPSTLDPQKPPLVLPSVGGRFIATNAPLRLLIQIAFEVQDFQIVGGPSWIATSVFEITATIPEATPATLPSITPLLRTLLAERFGLRTHGEKREHQIYALRLVRDANQLGPNLKPSITDCSNASELAAKRTAAVAAGGVGALIFKPGETVPCAAVADTFGGGFGLRANGQPLVALTQFLMPLTERIVRDETGLSGLYDWDLRYDPGVPQPGRASSQHPDLFTAVREQLGLKLETDTAPIDVIVIDSVERPTPN